jgi:sugar phosphate isomerase/epimerase
MTDSRSWKIGVTSGGIMHLTADKYMAYAAGGVDAIELSYAYAADEGVDIHKQKAFADAAGVTLWSMHLPWHHQLCNIAHKEKEVKAQSVAFDIEMIKKAADIGIRYAVIHPSGEPIAPEDRSDAMKYAKECLSKLAGAAKNEGMVIAVENLPRTCLGNCSKDMLDLMSADDGLRMCFDVNHLLLESHSELLKHVSDRIVTLHISDYDFINERHWMPGEGRIDWVQLIDSLESINYNGVFMYELNLKPEKTIRRRDLTYSDFYNNHKALSNREKPEIIGIPNL